MTTTVTPATAPARPGLLARLGLDTVYVFTAFPLGVAGFVLAVTGLSVGVATLIIWVGIPVLTATLLASTGLAQLERLRLAKLQGREFPHTDYRAREPGLPMWRRLLEPLRDPQSWLDVVWGLFSFVSGTAVFCIACVWWAATFSGLTYWFWEQWLPNTNDETLASLLGFGDSTQADIVANTVVGVVALVTLPLVMRALAWVHASLADVLLNSRADLQSRVRRAEGAREAAQSAEAVALRRLERDIHDGPQQRLVRLTMDLGRARRQLDDDPQRAADTVETALHQAREAVDELRALSRGIAPPLLVDRGLVVALDELAARSAVEVELSLDVPTSLPAEVETAVYFTVSEALTNVAKHAGVDRARVRVGVEHDHLLVEVRDEGAGGAHPGKGQGLAGLEQRLTAVDGTLEVASPEGGPTRVVARVPLR